MHRIDVSPSSVGAGQRKGNLHLIEREGVATFHSSSDIGRVHAAKFREGKLSDGIIFLQSSRITHHRERKGRLFPAK